MIIHTVFLRFPKASPFVFLNFATPLHSEMLDSPLLVQKSLTCNLGATKVPKVGAYTVNIPASTSTCLNLLP